MAILGIRKLANGASQFSSRSITPGRLCLVSLERHGTTAVFKKNH
jgi:hypothetical protein